MAGKPGHGLVAELLPGQPFAPLGAEGRGGQLFPVAGEFIPQKGGQVLIFIGTFVHHRLGGGEAAQLVAQVRQPLGAGKGGGVSLAGGDVADAQRGVLLIQKHTGAEVAAAGLQAGAVDDGAGGDHTDDVPLHQALGLGRVLGLLADGHLVALGDEPGDVAVGGVVGDAAHGDALLRRLGLVLVTGGEGQLQLPGGGAGIVAEHLVEIAQAEKENGIRVVGLDFQILAHHGGQLSHGDAPFRMSGGDVLRRSRFFTLQ